MSVKIVGGNTSTMGHLKWFATFVDLGGGREYGVRFVQVLATGASVHLLRCGSNWERPVE